MTMASNYLKRFEVWATASWEQLKHSLLRTIFARDVLESQKLFISNVAHELRTPISTIKTTSEVALLDERLPAPLRRTFVEILEELTRISEILNNLLSLNALTRPERMNFSNVDLYPLAQASIRRHLPLARERGIKILLRKEPGAICWGNPTALEAVMTNLIKNALSYTPKGTDGVVTITVRPEPHGPEEQGLVVFSVADTGIGLSQEDLYHIFEPFYRADTSRVRQIKKSGSGLGLTIVNEMVKAHQGRIHVESRRRKGTTVSIYLPRGGAGTEHTAHEESEATLDFTHHSATV